MRPLLQHEIWQTGPHRGKYKLSKHQGMPEAQAIRMIERGL